MEIFNKMQNFIQDENDLNEKVRHLQNNFFINYINKIYALNKDILVCKEVSYGITATEEEVGICSIGTEDTKYIVYLCLIDKDLDIKSLFSTLKFSSYFSQQLECAKNNHLNINGKIFSFFDCGYAYCQDDNAKFGIWVTSKDGKISLKDKSEEDRKLIYNLYYKYDIYNIYNFLNYGI